MGDMRQKQTNHRQIVGISFITAACLVGDSMLYIVLPMHWQSVGLHSLWEVGVILSFNRLVRLPLNPLVGWIYGKISNRSGMLLASVLAALTTICYGVADTFLFWLVLRGLWGVSWTFLRLGAYYEILRTAAADNRGQLLGVYNGLYRLGSLFGMLVGGFCADFFGLKTTAYFLGVLTCLTIPLGWIYLPQIKMQLGKDGLVQPVGNRRIWSDDELWWVMGTGLFVALVYQGLFAATLTPLIEIKQGQMLSVGGFFIGCASLAGILQAIRWAWEPWLAPYFGRASDLRYGRSVVMAAAFGVAAVCFVFVIMEMPFYAWLLVLLALQLTGTVLTTVADAAATDAAATLEQTSVLTWFSFFVDLGAALGPMLGYFLISLWGMEAAYVWTAVILLVFFMKWMWKAPRVLKRI